MARKGDAEELFRNIRDRINKSARAIEQEQANAIAKGVAGNTVNYEVKQKGNQVTLDEIKPKGDDGLIDLKKYFKQSSKAKRKTDGGWYLVVPIRLYASRNKSKSSMGMTNRLYNDVRSHKLKADQNSRRIITDYLYDNRRGNFSPIKELEYTPKSNEITRIRNQQGINKNSSTYVAFRTVSDKSHPASWLINRGKADMNKDRAEIERIMKEVRKTYSNS